MKISVEELKAEMLFIKANLWRELGLEKVFVLSLLGFYSAAQNLICNFEQDGEEQLYRAIEQAKLKSSKLTFRNIVNKVYWYLRRVL